MMEQDKQVSDQQKKQVFEKEHQKHPTKKQMQEEQAPAGKATDPEAMKDKGYVERIDEKTSKH